MVRPALALLAALAPARAGAAPAAGAWIDTSTAAPACAALEAVAAALDGDAGHWVERPAPGGSRLEVRVTVARGALVVKAPEAAQAFPLDAGPVAAADAALRTRFDWRPPPGLSLGAWLAPSAAAWAAACGAEPRSTGVAGGWAATGPLLTRLARRPATSLGPPVASPVAEIAAAGTASARWRAWRRLAADLDDDRVPPVWTSTVASAGARFARADPVALALFDAGRFIFLEPASGRVRGAADVGTAEPELRRVGDAWVAVTDAGLVALEPDGATRWIVREPDVFPELAVRDDVVCAASPERAACHDASTGRARWTRVLAEPAVGGPVLAGRRLVLPVAHHLDVLALDDGHRTARARMREEISAPLIATRDGDVWVFAGADALLRFDPDRGVFERRFDGLPPLAAPPVAGPSGLFLEVEARRGRALWRAEPMRVGPWRTRAEGPILPLPDFLGVAVFRGTRVLGMTPFGDPHFTTRLDAAPTLGVAGADWLALGGARRVWLLDGRAGTRALTVTPLAPDRASILDLAWTPLGGAALAAAQPGDERGVLSGLPRPGDPRLQALRAAAVRGVIESGLDAGFRRRACAELAGHDLDAQWALEARLRCPDQAEAAARLILERAPPAAAAHAAAAARLRPEGP